uniref:Polycystin-1-like protein 1 n=1 Tax=Nannospalax galili TaxID=1026970 RepID=A0A8C6QJD0_NANGA
GSVVYSNYCVAVEVRPRAPVSVISEGTHIFIPRATSMPIILRGSQSYDPDNPGAALRYYWTCTASSLPGWPCFDDSTPHQVDTRAPAISFPAKCLSECCDQFIVTLTVSSNGQNSSQAQVFLSTRPDPAFRFVHISWVNFKDIGINWNEELSLQALCEDCGDARDLSYSWDLFLVNATEKSGMQVPFCSTVGLLGTSALGAILKFSEPNLQEDPSGSLAPHSLEPLRMTLDWPAPSILGRTSTDSTAASHETPAPGLMAGPDEPSGDGSLRSLGEEVLTVNTPEGSWPFPSSSPAFDEFEAYYSDIQEALPSRGRQPGNSTNLLGSGPSMNAEARPSDGDNLLDPFLHTGRAEPALMIDWPKTLVSSAVFYGYTSSGIMGPVVTIKPYSLSSGETYVLQASVASKHGLLGKAQLYLMVNKAPQDMACQVQPHHGLEAHTIFSVFCMSGKPDFHYEFRYWIGNASSHSLYRGQDTHYYFSLPAGETSDNYKVIISTEITDGQGSKVQPCTAVVTVLPRYHGNDCPDEDLYHSSLRNLSTLQLMGSYMEIRNYITMVTGILNRLAKESRNTSCGLWSQIQDALISSACQLPFTDQEAMMDSIWLLRDLISIQNKLSFMSAMCIFKYIRLFLAQGQLSGRFVVNRNLSLELVLLISGVWEAAKQGKMRNEDYLQEEAMKLISEALLHRFHMSTEQMESWTLIHRTLQSSVQNLGCVRVHLPGDLAWHSSAQEETQGQCYISQLMFFTENPYPGGRSPGQVGGVLSLMLYSCSSRKPIRRGRLETPVTVEFGEEDHPRNTTMFTLLRDEVNLHRFVGLSENPQESLQICIEFSEPVTRAFPIMLLVRFSEKPTPSDFLVKEIYFWDKQTVQIYIPAIPRKGSNVGYLSLLDADYDRRPPNKYFARTVNYTVHFQWIQCVFWDKTEWRSEGFSPQPGTSGKINCSYHRLTPFSVLQRKLNSSFEVNSISKFQSHPQNLLPSILTVVFMVLYGCLVIKSRCVNRHERKKTGCIFLKEDSPPGHQLYAIVIDTGFRSPAQFTSKVFIVLCGENGLSETKELYCPERSLFERNSRHTFVLSARNHLGPLRKIHLWHDSSGPSPSWFISHVIVKELRSGQAWFFPAQCWLAVSQHDGCVQRELTRLCHGLGFWKLFYSKFMEYLEDFHVWLSPYSQPTSSSYPHTQRLAVSFCLLCVYACLTALVTVEGHEQHPLDVGPTNITLRSFSLGLLCTLLASPGAQLLSLLFRQSKEALGHPWADSQGRLREAKTEAPQGPTLSQFQNPASHILSESDQAWRTAASGNDVAYPSLQLEACGDEELTLREKIHHSPPTLQAPSSDSEGFWPQQSRAYQPWTSSVAWIICWSVSLACASGTGFLGYRFVPTQCMWWLHLLALSIICCVFVTQPLMICVVALAFAWKRKDDSQFFTESLCDATKDLNLELEYSRIHDSSSSSYCAPTSAGEAEKILAARQRERHLRWAQPPSTAQLRVTRERLRRESHMQAALRDVCMHSLLLLQLLLLIYGRFCPGERSLNQAIRKEFTRNARRSLEDLSSTDDWWDWTLSTMLDGLYPGGSSAGAWGAQPDALGGQCHLIGTSVIKQLKVSSSPGCKPHRPFSAFMEDSLHIPNPELDFENRNMTPGGPEACRMRRESYMHSLGKTRLEAHAALTALRTSRWISCSTRAMSVHFTLYNPSTQLFTSVSLGAEVLPTGGLVPWSLVESFSIFRSDSVCQYHLVFSELMFLVLNMTRLCFQLWEMATKGVLSYWRKPRHWLELSVSGVALVYCAASGHLTTLAGDVTDQFRKGLCPMFVDFSLMALWNQRVRWLQGILLFLWMWKCILLPGFLNTTVSSPVIRPSLSRLFLVGVLLLATHCRLCRFLLFTWMPSSWTSADVIPGPLFGFLGRSQKDSWQDLWESDQPDMAHYLGALFLLAATLCFGMLRASVMTFFRKRKSVYRKSLVTLKDVAVYLWRKVLTFLRLETPGVEETEVATDHNYYLDEFSTLLDELLMKIDDLSDSLEFSILEEQLRRRMETGKNADI